jgi:hypothetical protein
MVCTLLTAQLREYRHSSNYVHARLCYSDSFQCRVTAGSQSHAYRAALPRDIISHQNSLKDTTDACRYTYPHLVTTG